jgi:hypothetical protein
VAAEIGGHPAGEGIWRRAWRDTTRAGQSLGFGAAVVVASLVVGAIGGALSGAIAFAATVLLLFVAMLLRAPVKQRDEARALINPAFPRHDLKLKPPWDGDLEVTDDRTARVMLVPLSVTNREPRQRMSLDLDLIAQLAFDDRRWSKGMHLRPYTRDRTTDTFDAPLAVEPETTTTGTLQFDGSLALCFDFQQQFGAVAVKPNWRVRLHVIDRVSDARLELELPPPLAREGGRRAGGRRTKKGQQSDA